MTIHSLKNRKSRSYGNINKQNSSQDEEEFLNEEETPKKFIPETNSEEQNTELEEPEFKTKEPEEKINTEESQPNNIINYKNNKMSTKLKKNWLKIIGIVILSGIALSVIGGTGIIFYFSKDLPDPNKLSDRQVAESTKIYDRTEEHLLYEIYNEQKRTQVELEEIVPWAIQATVAMEDKHFYEHSGIRLLSIARAGVNNLLGRKSGGGGASTLTQQLIKKTIVGDEHSIFRKIKEAILAVQLEKKYTKDQIIKLYLNEIPYGSTNYGIEAAAESYFHTSAKELKLHEAATLAALIQAPSRYLNDLNTLRGRRDTVLFLMKEQGYINDEEKNEAQNKAIRIYRGSNILASPHFVLYVKQQLAEQFGEKVMETGGLKVITTLDFDKQKLAEEIVKEIGDKNLEEKDANNAALIAIQPKTGQILSMVGSRDFYDDEIDGQYNVAVLGKRQPGSSLKPLIYTAAWEKGYTPDTVLYDVLTDFERREGEKGYIPQNYSKTEHGLVTMRKALQGSLNISAVKTLYLVGISEAIEFTNRFGYTTLSADAGLSLVLGGSEVNLLEHTASYATFANNGTYQKPISILEVQNNDGDRIFEWKQSRGEKAIKKELADLTSSVLSDNKAREYAFGPVNNLILEGRPVAAKTGTTNDAKDAWTLGYTPSLAVGVWVGNTIPSTMQGGGHTLAGPIWQKFMAESLKNTPVEQFDEPEKNEAKKPILRGADGGIKLKINKFTEKLAASTTPDTLLIEKTYLQPHTILHYVIKDNPDGPLPENPGEDAQYTAWEEALQDWVKREKEKGNTISFEEPPTEYDNPDLMGLLPTLKLIFPTDRQIVDTQNINFEIKASAPRGITRSVYKLDGMFIGTPKQYPFNLNHTEKTLSKGAHDLIVFVEDDLGNRIIKEIRFYVIEKPANEPEPKIIEETPKIIEEKVAVEETGMSWVDGKTINLKASDFPRVMSIKPNLYNEKVKEIRIYLTRTDSSKPHIYTFVPGEDKMKNELLSFTWRNSPGSGTSQLTAVLEDKDGNKKEAYLKIIVE